MQSSNQHSNQPYPRFHEPQPSNLQRAPLHPPETSFAYRGHREDPPSSPHDYRERLSSNPLRSQGASVWEGFPQGGSLHREPVNTEPRPLMQNVIDRVTTGGRRFEGVQSTNPVPQTGLSSFDGGEVHGENRFGDFSLDDSRMQEYSVPGAENTGPSGHWQNNSHRGVRRDHRGSGDFSHPSSATWPHSQKAYPSSRGTSQPRLRGQSGENQGHYQDTLSRDHSLGPYGQASGRSLGQGGLLGHYSEHAGLGSMSGRYGKPSGKSSLLGSYSDLSNEDNLRPRSGDDRFQSSSSSQPMKRTANRPQRGRRGGESSRGVCGRRGGESSRGVRGRRGGESSRGVRGSGSNQSSVTARDSWSEAHSSGVGERMSRSRRHSSPVAVISRLKIKTELRDPDFERRPEESKTVNRDANQSWNKVSNSFGCSETFVKHEPSLEFGDLVRSARSPSPVSIQKRLGPHIPGSGSVQNRLGPPNEGIGVHSRLGPQENFSGSLPSDNVHSLLGLGEGMGPPLTSESVYSRLGPEENRGSLPSEGVHSRLGPEISSPGGPRVKTEPIFSNSPSDTLQNFYTDSPPLSSAIPMDLDNEEHGTQEPDLRMEIQGRQSLCAPSNLNLPSSVDNSPPCFGNRPSSRSPHTEILPSDYPPVSHFHGDPSTGSRPQTPTPYLLGSTSSTSLTSSQQLLKLNLTSGELSVAGGWRGSSSPLPEIGDLAQPPVSFDGGVRLGEERFRRFSLESGSGRVSPLTSFEGCGRLGEESSGRFSHELGSERSPLQESFSSRRDSLTYTAGNSKSEPTSFARRPDLKLPLKHNSGVTESGVSPRMRDLAKGSKSPSTVSPSHRSSNQSQLSSPSNLARSSLEESVALRSGVDARPFVATSSTRSQPPVIATRKTPEAGSRAPGKEQAARSKEQATRVKEQAARSKEQAAKSPTPTSVGQSIPVLLGKYSQSQPPVSTGCRIKDLPKPTKSPEKSKSSSSSSIKPNRTNTAFTRSTTPRKLATNRGKTAGTKKGKAKPTSKEKEKCSVNVVKELDKRKEAASTGPSPRIRVEQRRSSAVELDPKECGYSVMSVTSVATLESELEEGELTDSDCEGLIIDLDQSCSSSSAPTPNKCRADKRRSSESRDVDGESDPQDQQETKAMGDVPKDHQGTKAMGDVPKDHQGTTAMGDVPTDHQGTKAMGDVPKDHQGTKAMGDVPTDHQGTKAMGDVPKDHQETKTQSDASRTKCETTLSDYNQSDPNVTKSSTSTTDIVEKPIKSSTTDIVEKPIKPEASSLEPAAPEEELTSTGPSSKLLNKRVRTAAMVVGLHLARKLDTVTCENSSSSVLLMLRSASSQLSQTLRFTFRQWKKPHINVDAALAYVQLRLPEVAAGRASVAKLAGLICMDSTTFFMSDVHTLFQHCEEDVGKWSVVSHKYYNEVRKQLTMAHLKTNFPKSVHKKTGESVTALVQQHVSKLSDVKGSTRWHFPETMPQPSFLDVARLKYGPPFMQVLDRIQKRFEEAAAEKARSSDLFQHTSAVATTHARISTGSTESGASPAQQLLSPSSLSNSTPVGSQSMSNSLAKLAQQSAPVSLFLHTHSASASHVETSVPIQPLLQTPVPIPSPSQPPIQPLFRPISPELQSGKPPVCEPSHYATPPATTKVLPLFLTLARNSPTSSTADSSVHIPSSRSSFSVAPVLPITSSQLPKTTISPPVSQPVATTSPKNAVEARDEGAVSAAIANSQSVFTTQVADNRQMSSSLMQNTAVGVAPAMESHVATVEASEPSIEQSEPQQHVLTSETHVAKPEARVAATSNETLLHKDEVLHSEQRSENENIAAAAAELKLKEPPQDAAVGGTVREDGALKSEVKLATENPVLSSETVVEEVSIDASSKGVFETENLAAVSDNDSVSSGEIVSPTPSPPDRHDKLSKEGSLSYSQVGGAYSKEAYWHSTKGGKSDWRGRSDFNSPPRRRSLPRTYDYRRNRSPSPRNRRRDGRGIGERREWGRPRGGGRSYRERSIERRRRSRSKSWSGSPVLEKDRHSRRWSRDSFSPEERMSVRRRRTCNSLSPDGGSRKFGHAYEKWSRQQRDDGRRGEREGRERERKPTSDKSRDPHTNKDSRGPDSDEDLEVLELRKEAIMSMLKDPLKGDGKSVKGSEKEASCGKDENSESVGGMEEERQRPEEAVERNSSTSETEAKEQRVKLKEATGESGTAVEEVPKEETVIEKAELQAPPDEIARPTMAVTSSPEEDDIRSEMDVESKPGNDKGDNEVTLSKAASSEKSPDAKSSAKELLSVDKKNKEISSLSRPGAPKVMKTSPRTSPACALSPHPSSQPSPAPSSQPSPGPSSQPSLASVEPPSPSTATTSITKPPPSPSNTLSVPTAAGATSQATSRADSPKISATKKMGTLSVKQTLMFKATSLPTSRSGSRVSSPASSRGSPAPLPALLAMEPGSGSGLETGSGSRCGSNISRISSKASTSVKIVPGSKATWEIPVSQIFSLLYITFVFSSMICCLLRSRVVLHSTSLPLKEFNIQVEDSESEEEQTESETEPEATGSGGEGVKSAHRPPTMDEIDSVLGLFRRDAEVNLVYLKNTRISK